MKPGRRLKDQGKRSLYNPLKTIGAAAFVLLLVIGVWWYSGAQSDQSSLPDPQVGMTCDMGISAAKSAVLCQ